jgi:hypothetical protein
LESRTKKLRAGANALNYLGKAAAVKEGVENFRTGEEQP